MSLSKSHMEAMSSQFRKNLGLKNNDPFEPFDLEIEALQIVRLSDLDGLAEEQKEHLLGSGSRQWSAMSVPLDEQQESWTIVVNDSHDIERQRVSLLEEVWHILQGHKLTTITKVGQGYGRSFESEDEHDAYYLAASTLVPADSLMKMVMQGVAGDKIATHFGVSKDLVEYRIKRLGLWSQYKGRKISLAKKP